MIFQKDPDATLDYTFDWSNWLEDGEAIASRNVTVENGITLDSSDFASPHITVWLSGGTAGETYDVTCEITTDNLKPRTDQRTMKIEVKER